MTSRHFSTILPFALLASLYLYIPALGQDAPDYTGRWVLNSELSDNTDKEVERALRAMGQKVARCWFGCEEDRFRGGPEEQELYDRISYDKTLTISQTDSGFLFTYDDDYQRPVYTDGRRQSVSLQGLDQLEDFSFGHRENNRLLVEARPRDGGFANETYSLIEGGSRLRVEMYIQPKAFSEAITLVRVFDRIAGNSL